MDLRARRGSKKCYLGNWVCFLALKPSHAAAASALSNRPMKAAFVAVTAAVIRCRQYFEDQVVGHVGADAAWEWRMLNSLAILTWLKTFLRNALAAGPRGPFADTVNHRD